MNMRRLRALNFISLVMVAVALPSLTCCDAMWDTSVGYDPNDYYISTGPGYWGGVWNPSWGYYPYGTYNPGYVPLPPPAGGGPNRPPSVNRPPFRPSTGNNGGNVNPGLPGGGIGSGSQPAGSRPSGSNNVVPPSPIPGNQINGGQPGVVMPPAGSGMSGSNSRH